MNQQDKAQYHRKDIQGLRALAVILVILCHTGMPFFQGGFVGVDIFFVISGFVITGLLLRQPQGLYFKNLQTFYTRRILRIVPAATLVLVSTPIAAYLALGKNMDPALMVDVRWANLFAANWRLTANNADYFIAGVDPSLITHYWSLAVEEQFYFVFPGIVFGFLYFALLRKRTIYFQTLLITLIALSGWWSWLSMSINPVHAYYSPFTRFWELALGALAATISIKKAREKIYLSSLLNILGVVGIGVSLLVLSPRSNFPGLLAWIPCSSAVLLLLFGNAPRGAVLRPVLNSRLFVGIGNISYSLYLWHFIWLQLPKQMGLSFQPVWVSTLGVIGALVCAIGSYKFLENPIRNSEKLRKDPLALLLFLVFCIGLTWNSTLLVDYLLSL